MLTELKNKAKKLGFKLSDYCEGVLINKGYVWNDCFGWEKPEILKSFNLNPDMKSIPARDGYKYDEKHISEEERDEFGQKTGKKITRVEKYETNEKTIYPTQNWLNYIAYKKEQDEKQSKDEYIAEKQLEQIILN